MGNIISSWRLAMPNHGFQHTAALIKSLSLNAYSCITNFCKILLVLYDPTSTSLAVW